MNDMAIDLLKSICQPFVLQEFVIYFYRSLLEYVLNSLSIHYKYLFSDSNHPTITVQPQEASGVSQEASVESSIITHEKAEVDKNESLPVIKETIKYIDKPQRKITEIRIFFDDGTYEVFPGNR